MMKRAAALIAALIAAPATHAALDFQFVDGDAGSFWMNSPDRNRIGLGIYKDLCINC